MSSGFGLSTGRRKELLPQDAAGYLLLLCFAILSPRRNGLLETAKHILLILSALFPIVNPLGGSPVFLALTRHYPASARRALARKVAMNSFVLLIASFLVGTHILHFFGISIPVVQVGGGLVVISNGWAMLKQKEEPDRGRDVQKKVDLEDICVMHFMPSPFRSPSVQALSRMTSFSAATLRTTLDPTTERKLPPSLAP